MPLQRPKNRYIAMESIFSSGTFGPMFMFIIYAFMSREEIDAMPAAIARTASLPDIYLTVHEVSLQCS